MRKRNVLMMLAASAMLLQLIVFAGPAQAVDITFTFSPISGQAGTVITFSGTGCPPHATEPNLFFLAQGNDNTEPEPFTSNADGTFSGTYDTAGLAAGQYTTVISCPGNTASPGGLGDAFTVLAPPPTPPALYHPLAPTRILDTRDGTGTGGAGPLGADSTIDVTVTGVGGVPIGATAVALNVTATNATAYSYLTVWPNDAEQPLASNINFYPGRSTPNLVKAKVGAGGKVSIYNIFGTVDVLADVQGWYSDVTEGGSNYVPLNPARILDTRDGTGAPAAQIGPDSSVQLKTTGIGGVPVENVAAVVLNVTATNASSTESFLTLFPSGGSVPLASNLNFVSGEHVPNLVIARIGEGGNVSIFNKNGTVDVVADVQGYYTAGSGARYLASNPVRILDTRNGTGVPGGFIGQLGTGDTLALTVAGVGGVPESATAVVLNMAVADSPGPASYLTVYPQGTQRPLASNLNWAAGQTKSLLVVARLANGKVSIYNNLGSANVIADVQGWFVPTA